MWSSGVIWICSKSGTISVGTGEGGGGWDRDDPVLMLGVEGVVSIGVRVKGDRPDAVLETVEGSVVRLEVDCNGDIVDDVLAAG